MKLISFIIVGIILLFGSVLYSEELGSWIFGYTNELPLRNITQDKYEAYRLFIQPSGYIDRVIRIENRGGQYSLVYKRGQNSGPDPKFIEKKITISKSDWDGFKKLAEEMSFWQFPEDETIIGLDGITYILEGQLNGKYRVIKRWAPDWDAVREQQQIINQNGQFLKACTYLKKLAEVNENHN